MDTIQEQTFRVKLHNGDEGFMPVRSFPSDAGFDLKARAYCRINGNKVLDELELTDSNTIKLTPAGRVLIKTGVFIELLEGWEAQVRCRSGMALKNGITVVNSPGTVDASYRNEIGVILLNTTVIHDFVIARYDRIAQLVIKRVPTVHLTVVEELNATDRNMGGFGSTGK